MSVRILCSFNFNKRVKITEESNVCIYLPRWLNKVHKWWRGRIMFILPKINFSLEYQTRSSISICHLVIIVLIIAINWQNNYDDKYKAYLVRQFPLSTKSCIIHKETERDVVNTYPRKIRTIISSVKWTSLSRLSGTLGWHPA